MSEDESESIKLDISIPFEMSPCDGCGKSGAGKCGSCGKEISPPEFDSYANARRQALRAAAERADRLLSEMRSITQGRLPLAPDQFLAAVEELDLWEKLDDLDSVGKSFDGLDFHDKKVVGSDIRIAIDRHLDKVEQVLDALQMLARFEPAPPAGELFERIHDTCCCSAELADSLLKLFRAPTYRDGEAANARAQSSWEKFLETDDLTNAKRKVDQRGEESLNARTELALGRSGEFLDEDGSIDPGRILLSFSDEALPLDALAASINRYFDSLLHGKHLDASAAPGLVGPLVLLAGTERPVAGHRVAELMAGALLDAYERDPESVRSLAERGSSEGPTIYAALARVQRAFTELKEDSADSDSADRIMVSYRQISESIFRTIGWLAVDLEALIDGKQTSDTGQPPMLGELRDRLNSGGALGQALALGVDVGLRNAEAHVQYRWIPERGAIRDWRTEEEWDVDRLLDSFHRLTAVVAGSDAAFTCFVSGHAIAPAPEWLYSGEAPEIYSVLATLTFSSRGLDVHSVSRDGATIVLSPPPDPDPSPILSGLAGYATFCRQASSFRIEDTEGKALAQVQSATMNLFAEAKPATKGLATIAIAFESAVQTGMEPGEAGADFLALATKSIAVESMQELVETELSPRAFQRLADRLNYLRDLVAKNNLGFQIPRAAELRAELGRIRALIKPAKKGQQSALELLLKGLREMWERADAVEAIWPPKSPE
jgi:hypothetical protein